MDCWLCVCAYVGGGWLRRAAGACAAVRTAGRNACTCPNPGAANAGPRPRQHRQKAGADRRNAGAYNREARRPR